MGRPALLFSPALLVLACSSAFDDSLLAPGTVPGPIPPPGAGLSARDTQLLGSYELVFDRIEPTDKSRTLPPLPAERASIGNRARLDVRGTPDAKITGILTPRWGAQHHLSQVTVRKDELVLEGDKGAQFEAPNEDNTWWTLVLHRAADGSLDGGFGAHGLLAVGAMTIGVNGSGVIRSDPLVPEIRVVPPLKSRGGKWLPWDSMSILFAEPLLASPFTKPMKDALPDLDFVQLEPSQPARMEVTGLFGMPRSFDRVTRSATIGAAVKDPSGNVLVPIQTEIGIHVVGAARPRHDFDTNAELARWGGATRVADARCEKGGCLLFPASSQVDCTMPSGAAGVLTTNGGLIKKVKARVRVLASDEPGSSAPPRLNDPLFVLLGVVSPYVGGGEGTEGLTVARTGTGDLPWASPWMTFEVTLSGPTPPAEIGFALVRPVCQLESVPENADVRVSVLIDDVWAE